MRAKGYYHRPNDRYRRRLAAAPALLGDPDHRPGHRHGGDRRRHRQCRLAHHRPGSSRQPVLLVWIVNGYQLAITISLLPLAALGDIIGYRRVYLAGLALFTLASLFCALSHTLLLLTLARIVQGFGAAGIMSVNAALVRFTYPRKQLGHGIGINALVVAVSAAVGPTIAAGILSVGTWPLAVRGQYPVRHCGGRGGPPRLAAHAARAAFFRLAGRGFERGDVWPRHRRHRQRRPWRGALFFLTEFAAAAIACAVLVRRELGAASPMLPVDLLRIPIFALSICTSVASFCAQMLAFVALPFYLQDRFGYSAVQIGLLITPWPIAVGFAAPIAGRLAERHPAGLLGGIGLVVFAAGLALLALLPAHPSLTDIIWRMALAGVGFGLFQSPNNRTMIAAAPRERSGGASGMLGTARLLGQTIGAALVALLLARYPADGTRIALVVGAGFALAGAALSALRLSEAGARGEQVVRVLEAPRATGE